VLIHRKGNCERRRGNPCKKKYGMSAKRVQSHEGDDKNDENGAVAAFLVRRWVSSRVSRVEFLASARNLKLGQPSLPPPPQPRARMYLSPHSPTASSQPVMTITRYLLGFRTCEKSESRIHAPKKRHCRPNARQERTCKMLYRSRR
jgi:hypothetical protein